MIGITIVSKKEYQKYLQEEKLSLLKLKNRIYRTKYDELGNKILLIEFSECGFQGAWKIIYNINNNQIESFYSTLIS